MARKPIEVIDYTPGLVYSNHAIVQVTADDVQINFSQYVAHMEGHDALRHLFVVACSRKQAAAICTALARALAEADGTATIADARLQ